MKKYISFFRLRFLIGLSYRTAALAGIVTQFVWGVMEIMVYRAFYRADAAAFPMSFSATASYIWLQQAFLAVFMMWIMENEIFDAISDGNIAYELCRPVRIYDMWFARSMANRLAKASLRCFPILIVAAFIKQPYGLAGPAGIKTFLLFLITMVLGLLVTAAFCNLIYVLTFFMISPMGLKLLAGSAVEFLSGAIIPLPFLPDRIRFVVELLPFASMQNIPLRVYSGNIAGAELIRAAALQVFWIAALVLVGKILCAIAVRRVTVQGG